MSKFEKIKNTLEPYIDIILFCVCMFGANFLWKAIVNYETEEAGPVYLFSRDITPFFDVLCVHICKVVYFLVSLTRDSFEYYPPHSLFFSSTGAGESIVWGCTGVKQGFIWFMIMLFARGSWKKKLWYIPIGWVYTYLFNIFRIYVISLVIEHHSYLFNMMHTYLFKYLFYAGYFVLWIIWVEKIKRIKN